MKLKLLFLILLSVLCISTVSAQKNNKKITITGTVLDASKKPVVNAMVMVDGKETSSVTNSKGQYKIKVKPSASKVGIFTFGIGIMEEVLDGRTTIDFNFGKSVAEELPDQTIAPGEEGVDVGYGYVKKKNVTNQVDNIDGTNKKYASYSSIADMLQREVSGIKISGSEVILHDSKNMWGSIPALIVVDGVYITGLPDVSPSQVKSIEVLKGSAAAMYGSRGYGGVILIKTKLQNN